MNEIIYKYNIRLLLRGLGIVMFGFCSIQQFVTILIDKETALYSLCLIYGSFLIGCFFGSKNIIARFGAKQCLIYSPLAFATFILSLLTQNTPLIFFASIIDGLGASIFWNGIFVTLANNSQPHNRGKNSGRLFRSLSAYAAFGIILIGALNIEKYASAILILYALLVSSAGLIFKRITHINNIAKPHIKSLSLVKLLKNNKISLPSINSFISYYIYGICIATIPLYLQQFENLIWVTAIFFLIPAFASKFIGKLVDLCGRIYLLNIAYLISSLGGVGMILSQSISAIITSLIFLTLSFTILQIVNAAIQSDLTEHAFIEDISALFLLTRNIGLILCLVLNAKFSELVLPIALLGGVIAVIIQAPLNKLPLLRIRNIN